MQATFPRPDLAPSIAPSTPNARGSCARELTLRFGLGLRLFLSTLFVVCVGAGISAALVDRNVRERAKGEVEERLTYEVIMLGQMTANALFGPIDPSDTSLASVVKQLADAVHTDLALLAVDGTVVAASETLDVRSLVKEGITPEVRAALETGTGVSVRGGRDGLRMFVAQPIRRDGVALGIARASVPMTVVAAAASAARVRMAYGGLIALGIAAIVAGFLSLGILRPLRALAVAAKELGGGALAHRCPVASNDEIGDVARAMNEMAGRLEAMVGTLDQRNKDLRVVLDNVAQGLVTVDRQGKIAEERSRSIDRWFAAPPPGTRLWELFEGASPNVKLAFSMGWDQVFDGILPLELTLSQLPRRIKSGDQTFEIGCEPVGDPDNLEKCLVVISDVSHLVAAELSEAEQKEQLRLFAAVAKDREAVSEFIHTTGEIVTFVLEHATDRRRAVDVKRAIHTIKGNAGFFGLMSLSTLCHEIETYIAEAGECGPSQALLRQAETDALRATWDSLLKRVGGLLGKVPTRAMDITPRDVAELVAAIQQGRSADALIRAIASWTLEPVERRLLRLAGQATELAARMGKSGLTVDVEPSTARLPPEPWAPFWSSLSHVLRNALDHGIEPREERLASGKPEHGHLRMSVTDAGDTVVIEIADDGRGIEWARLREKAALAGLPSSTEGDLIEALFTDGMSTKDVVTELSGRGVGLSAVRAACEGLRGRIEIESSLSIGTTFRFVFPQPGMAEGMAKLKAMISIPPRMGVTPPPTREVSARTGAGGSVSRRPHASLRRC